MISISLDEFHQNATMVAIMNTLFNYLRSICIKYMFRIKNKHVHDAFTSTQCAFTKAAFLEDRKVRLKKLVDLVIAMDSIRKDMIQDLLSSGKSYRTEILNLFNEPSFEEALDIMSSIIKPILDRQGNLEDIPDDKLNELYQIWLLVANAKEPFGSIFVGG